MTKRNFLALVKMFPPLLISMEHIVFKQLCVLDTETSPLKENALPIVVKSNFSSCAPRDLQSNIEEGGDITKHSQLFLAFIFNFLLKNVQIYVPSSGIKFFTNLVAHESVINVRGTRNIKSSVIILYGIK